MEEYLYKNLSFKLIGLSYRVYNELGFGYQEKYVQRSYAQELTKEKLKFKKEVLFNIKYREKTIGRYLIDFVVDDKIAIEFKVAKTFYRRHLNQVLAYLKESDLKLGLLIIFTPDGVKCKRIINSKISA